MRSPDYEQHHHLYQHTPTHAAEVEAGVVLMEKSGKG